MDKSELQAIDLTPRSVAAAGYLATIGGMPPANIRGIVITVMIVIPNNYYYSVNGIMMSCRNGITMLSANMTVMINNNINVMSGI